MVVCDIGPISHSYFGYLSRLDFVGQICGEFESNYTSFFRRPTSVIVRSSYYIAEWGRWVVLKFFLALIAH